MKMPSRVPLLGPQAEESAFPINCEVYVCDVQDNHPSCIVASGTVNSVLLQMGRPGSLELLYKVKITTWESSHDTNQQYVLISESCLRFRNGCPVFVQVDDSECMGEDKKQEFRGIVLGFYDIPKDDERRPYCSHSFWYVVQICEHEDDLDKRICYNVSPSEIRLRRVDVNRDEIVGKTQSNAVEEKLCHELNKEVIVSNKNEHVMNGHMVCQTKLIIPDESISFDQTSRENRNAPIQPPRSDEVQMVRHIAKKGFNCDSSQRAAASSCVPIDLSSVADGISSEKDRVAVNDPALSRNREDFFLSTEEMHRPCEDVSEVNTDICHDMNQNIAKMNRPALGSKRSHRISNECPEEASNMANASPSKIRRIDSHVDDYTCHRENDASIEKNEVSESPRTIYESASSPSLNGMINKEITVHHDLFKDNRWRPPQWIDNTECAMVSPIKEKGLIAFQEKLTALSENCQHKCCWEKSCASEAFYSARAPPRDYPFGSVIFVPTSPRNVTDALIGYRGAKRRELMKRTKCWYAFVQNNDMQRIEIHGDTKTQVELGTEVIRDDLSQWLIECAGERVDIDWVSLNIETRYFVLDECNHHLGSTEQSLKVNHDQENTLKIVLLPPIDKNTLYSKYF
jgi:hypothetical protein